jgi:hypothetical protein
MKTIFTLRAGLLLAFILAVSVQGHTQFTPGNIVVSELTFSATTGSPVLISEYLPSTLTQATPVTSYALSQTAGSEFTGNGGTGGDGQISLSFDGRFITMGGYIAPASATIAAGGTSLRTLPRNIARIDAGGNITYSTNLTIWGSGGLHRNLLSIDGGKVWGTTSVGNTFLIDNTLPNPTDVASQAFTSSTTKRSATILKDNSGNYMMVEFDNTTSFKWAPIANDGTIAAATSVTYTTAAVINYGVAFVDVDPAKGWNNTPYDVLYVCNTGGIFKFSWDPTANAGAGGWIQNNASVYQAVVTGGVQNGYCGIVAYKNSNNKVTLNLITGNGSNNAVNQLITWEDNGWGVAPAATPGSIIKLATAGTGKIFKGISMAPTETWTGTTNTAYSTATNWKAGVVPATTRPIYVPTGLTNYPVVNADNTARGVFIESGASLTVNAGNLTVTGGITNNGTLTIENNANLIQTAATNTNSGSGAVTVKRNSNPLKRLDYTLWSSPVTGTQTLAQFSPETSQSPNRFYTYDTSANAYAATSFTNPFSAGTGYLIRMPNTADPVTPAAYPGVFTGTSLNNGNVSITTATSGYYAVGNPYPSTIDAAAFLSLPGNTTDGTLYFWRKTNGVANTAGTSATGTGYATWTTFGTAASEAAPNNIIPNGTIQVGQGFIVNSTGSSLTFTNAMRLGTASTQFFKTKQLAEKSRIWLNLTNTAGVFSQALVGYVDGASLGVDNGIDGKYINDSPIALTSNINNEEYTIQGRPAFDATDVVALNFKTDKAGDYSIAIGQVDGLFAAGQDIYLVDSKTGAETNLKDGAYNFIASAGVDNSRFSLKYQKTLKVTDSDFNENTVIVYKNKGTLYVNSSAKAISSIKVYDVQGRLLAEQKNIKANTATISNLKASNQILIVQVRGEDNSEVTKKVAN